MTAHLYRIYDAEGRLIYVGSSIDLFARLNTHRYSSWWADQAVKVKAQVFPDAASALAAERSAIVAERPRWNVMCNFPGAGSSRQQLEDYITARRNSPSSYCDRVKRSIANVERRIAWLDSRAA